MQLKKKLIKQFQLHNKSTNTDQNAVNVVLNVVKTAQ